MYGTVRRYAGSRELLDVLVAHEDAVKRLITEIDGFEAYYLIRTGEGDVVSISVYRDRDGAEESNRQAATWVQENAPGVTASAPEIVAGEVVITI